jgi:hypothetical protein
VKSSSGWLSVSPLLRQRHGDELSEQLQRVQSGGTLDLNLTQLKRGSGKVARHRKLGGFTLSEFSANHHSLRITARQSRFVIFTNGNCLMSRSRTGQMTKLNEFVTG